MAILNELLEKYQVRRTKQQKDAFLAFAQEECQKRGFESRIEEGKGSRPSKNLIAGDPEKAKIIFTAHYDTCAEMPVPNLIFPQNFPMTVLAQMPLILVMVGVGVLFGTLLYKITGMENMYRLGFLVVYFALLALIFCGPANKHTANDNTSGTAVLFQIMEMIPANQRDKAAFIFFDNEEYGKLGSKQFAKAHPDMKKEKWVLNLDCIGDGEYVMIVAPKKVDENWNRLLTDAFRDADGFIALHCSAKNTMYNSDQTSFQQGAAVAVCRKNKLGYHVPRIHTRRDIICDEKNLNYISRCAVEIVEKL